MVHISGNDIRNFVDQLTWQMKEGYDEKKIQVTTPQTIGSILSSRKRFFEQRFLVYILTLKKLFRDPAIVVIGLFNMMEHAKLADPSFPAGIFAGLYNPGYNHLYKSYNERIQYAVKYLARLAEPPIMLKQDFRSLSDGVHLRLGYEKIWVVVLSLPKVVLKSDDKDVRKRLKKIDKFCQRCRLENPSLLGFRKSVQYKSLRSNLL